MGEYNIDAHNLTFGFLLGRSISPIVSFMPYLYILSETYNEHEPEQPAIENKLPTGCRA